MQKLFKNKKGSTTVTVAVIIAALCTGAIVTGTVIVRNHSESISYEEAIDIAEAIPEVAAFIDENDINSVSANMIHDKWIVEFFATGFNYTLDSYNWINYAYVEIDATNGEVLYFEIFSPNEPNYTESEVIAIAKAEPEIANWLDTIEILDIYAWYDGFGFWFVDIITTNYASANVVINDSDGTVDSYDIYDPYADAKHTEAEIIAIVEALPEVQNWITNNPDYERYISISTVWICGDPTENITIGENEIIWFVDYWPTLNSTGSTWLNVVVSDETGEVLEINEPLEATMTEQEVIQLASSIPEISDFLSTITYTNNTWYDNYRGEWTVHFENIENIHEYAVVHIDDSTQEILGYLINDLDDPTLNQSEAIAIALAQQEVQDFITENPDYNIYAGFMNGYWYVDIIMSDNQTLPETGIIGISVLIDDTTGLVTEINDIIVATCD